MSLSSQETSGTIGYTVRYTLMGEKWEGSFPSITWSFAESSTYDRVLMRSYAGYPVFEGTFTTTQKELVRAAFQEWEDVGSIDFVEQADSSTTKIRIGWDSIDGPSIYGGTTLAQATMWSTDGNFTRSSIQVDAADKPGAYFGEGSPPHPLWSFYATVAHEIGHTLGLDHSPSSSALMYAYSSDVVTLSDDDIAGLLALYGQTQEPADGVAVVSNSIQNGVDTEMYLSSNPDVALAGVDPVSHFNTFGWREGRDPNAYFDVDFYLTANADVHAADINPLEHYLQFGWQENRNPSSTFSTQGYLEANPDVKLAGINPLLHYLLFGYDEGRSLA